MDGDSPSSTEPLAERASASRPTVWLLLDGPRWLVAVGALGIWFLALVVAGAIAVVPLPTLLEGSGLAAGFFQSLLVGLITAVTFVLTITQIVLSEEFGPAGDQQERMGGALAFRRDVEAVVDEPIAPANPASLLLSLVDATGDRAADLAEAVPAEADPGTTAVRSYAEDLRESCELVSDRLPGRTFGSFGVVSAALDFDYSMLLHEARALQARHGETLPGDASDALDGLVDTLSLFGPTREHVKTLYFRWELSRLSREIIYTSVPALAIAAVGALYLDDPGAVPGTILGVDNSVWAISAATTICLVPFAILLAYVLRIATVAKRTLAIGPTVLRDVDHSASDGGRERE